MKLRTKKEEKTHSPTVRSGLRSPPWLRPGRRAGRGLAWPGRAWPWPSLALAAAAHGRPRARPARLARPRGLRPPGRRPAPLPRAGAPFISAERERGRGREKERERESRLRLERERDGEKFLIPPLSHVSPHKSQTSPFNCQHTITKL